MTAAALNRFASEAEMVATFGALVAADRPRNGVSKWTLYHETAGWDVLVVHAETGVQIGVEAKLSLNAKVLDQALPGHSSWLSDGPDYRAVLVPAYACQAHMASLAGHLGITIIKLIDRAYCGKAEWALSRRLPDEASMYDTDWFSWLPAERCRLPDYVPDVSGGCASPLMLTPWKIAAIKLLILLDRTGAVTRKDMAALKLSPSRFTAAHFGFLERGSAGYVRCDRTPDLRAQHPVNYAEIEADFASWGPLIRPAGLL
jgi:hypothetical protein